MARANDLAITLKAKDLMSPVIRGAKSTLDNFKRDAVTGFGLNAGMGFANLAGDAFRGFINVMNDALRAARDLTEQQTKANYVFQDAANSVRVFAAGAADGFGMSERAALTALGTMGNLLTAIGQTPEEAAKMSLALTKLAADVSSFNNVASEDVLRAFQAALVGEAEPARRLGVNISMARVELEALAMGLASTKSEITDADKVTARYAIIMKDTSNAQGDFARTSENLANQQRILDANVENLSATMGKFVEGPAVGFVQFLNGMLEGLQGPTGVNAEILKLLENLGAAPPRPSALEIYFADLAAARERATGNFGDEAVTAGIINDADLMAFQRMGIEVSTITAIILRARAEVESIGPAIAIPKELYADQARRDIYNLIADVTGLRYTLAGVGMPAPDLFAEQDLRRLKVASSLLKDDQAISDRAVAMLRFQQDAKRASVVTGVLGVSMRNLAEETRSYGRALAMRGAAKDDQAISDRAVAMLKLERDTKRATIVTGTYGTTLVDLVGKENRLRRARVMSAMTKDDQAISDRAKAMIVLRRDTKNATVVTDTFGTSMKTAVDDAARLRSIFPGAFNWSAFWSRDLIPTADEAAQKAEDAFRAKMGSILPGAYNWNAFWSRNLVGSANEAGADAASKWVGSFRDTLRSQMDAIRDLADDIEWSLENPRKGMQLEKRLRRRLRDTWKDMRETNKIQSRGQREDTRQDIIAERLMIRALLEQLGSYEATVTIDTVVSGDAAKIFMDAANARHQESAPSKIRAHGGPTYAGETYLVGERGPELLVMGSTSGRVVPNDEIGGGNIVVNVDGERLFQVMNRRMGRSLAMGN